jgi:ribonuclease BN (tRNA processing enzyme)
LRLKVLGCHGGELPRCRTTCFLLDDVVALDAGALTSTLSLDRLSKLEHVIVGHSHFDHVKDLALISDLLVGRRSAPLVIHASPGCADALERDMFNDRLWPNFLAIPDRQHPVLRIERFEIGKPFRVGKFEVLAIPVHHPVESCAFLVRRGRSVLAMSGDTGPTDLLWSELSAVRDLRALLLETSFPDDMQWLADVSGHYTPQTVQQDLARLRRRRRTPLLMYHLKPAYLTRLTRDLQALGNPDLRVLRLDERFDL